MKQSYRLVIAGAALLCCWTMIATGPAAATGRTVAVMSGEPRFGVALPGAPSDMAELQNYTDTMHRAPELVTWYEHWGFDSDFPAVAAGRVAATGAVPEVTWMPWNPAVGVTDPAYTLDSITAGAHDAYIRRWARQIRAYRQPIVLRFAHEMNGSWYPWGDGVNGNGPGDYVTAWRHVRAVFTVMGAENVTWKWSPNVLTSSGALESVYPGDRFTDQVGLDGYNWGGTQSWSSWQSLWQVFGPSVADVRSFTSRSLFIAETGCTEVGGNKAAWITDMFATLAGHPEIRGFTWFNYDKETDWRIQSSQRSLDSFRRGLTTYA